MCQVMSPPCSQFYKDVLPKSTVIGFEDLASSAKYACYSYNAESHLVDNASAKSPYLYKPHPSTGWGHLLS